MPLLQLSPSERRVLASSPPQDRTTLLLRLWMHKESISKLLGTGASEDFSTVSFDLPPFPTIVTSELVELGAVLSTRERGDGRDLSDTRFLEGRLRCSEDRGRGYGVVIATRGDAEGSRRDVEVVEVERVLEGARLARAGSA